MKRRARLLGCLCLTLALGTAWIEAGNRTLREVSCSQLIAPVLLSRTLLGPETNAMVAFADNRQDNESAGSVPGDGQWRRARLADRGTRQGRWTFDGDHWNSVGTNHGTMIGQETYAGGYLQGALSLDGSNCLDLGPHALATSAYTKSAWIRFTGGWENHILSGDSTSNCHAFSVPYTYGYQLAAGHQGAWSTVRDDVSIKPGVWTHVAVTYDQAENGGTLRLYRNGRPTGGIPVATEVPPPQRCAWRLAHRLLPAQRCRTGIPPKQLWPPALPGTEGGGGRCRPGHLLVPRGERRGVRRGTRVRIPGALPRLASGLPID